MNQPEPVSLYLHIPFCTYRCSYCDFNTYTTLGDIQSSYADALAAEIRLVGRTSEIKRPVRSIFFGGGTPSVMSLADLNKIMGAVADQFVIQPTAEITLEANPETIDLAYVQGLKDCGINRISFGAQSALAQDLAVLGREHDFRTVINGVEMARKAGIDNLSIDLIYGVPGQTVESIEQTLDLVLPLGLPHLSLYCLTVEPGTPLHRDVNSGRIAPPDPDLAADQYDRVSERLAQTKLEQYEISNWAEDGLESQHNLAYWYNAEYLGLGAGAHGHAGGVRYQVVRRPRTYIGRITAEENRSHQYPLTPAVVDSHPVTDEEEMADTIIMGLRLLKEGLSDLRFAGRFGQSLDQVHGETLAELIEFGLIEWRGAEDGRALFLTEKGRFLSNQVFHRFI